MRQTVTSDRGLKFMSYPLLRKKLGTKLTFVIPRLLHGKEAHLSVTIIGPGDFYREALI